jgi:8-oxo-dGTP pyrophosphatase MutT (NUDIX family)
MKQISLAGCAFIKENKILLLRRIKTGWYELPGGKIDPGETAEIAAEREIQEELCVKIKLNQKIGQKNFEENGYTMKYTWFHAEINPDEKLTIGEPEKFDELKYISLEKLSEHKLSPNMENFLNEYDGGNINLNNI